MTIKSFLFLTICFIILFTARAERQKFRLTPEGLPSSFLDKILFKGGSRKDTLPKRIRWFTEYRDARIASIEQMRPLVVFFYTSWCSLCKTIMKSMEESRQFQELVNNHFILLAVSEDSQPSDSQWKPNGEDVVPRLIFLEAPREGEPIYLNPPIDLGNGDFEAGTFPSPRIFEKYINNDKDFSYKYSYGNLNQIMKTMQLYLRQEMNTLVDLDFPQPKETEPIISKGVNHPKPIELSEEQYNSFIKSTEAIKKTEDVKTTHTENPESKNIIKDNEPVKYTSESVRNPIYVSDNVFEDFDMDKINEEISRIASLRKERGVDTHDNIKEEIPRDNVNIKEEL